jgi:zinc/manganese transport system substrate-binding protein
MNITTSLWEGSHMRGKYLLLSVFIVPVLFGTPSCQPSTTSTKKTIVVTYSVLGSIVKELVGEKANVIVSIPNGLDPHEWEPSAKDIEAINKADLLVQNGLGLEGGMEKTLHAAQNKGVRFFTASDYITIRHVGPGEGIPTGDPDQAAGAEDPHLWMDPIAIKSIVSALPPILTKEFNLDVASQGKDLVSRLDKINREVVNRVATIPQENRKLVTGHESMGYFAQRYGFKLIGAIIPSTSTRAGVSAANLAALKKLIQENHVNVIFTELGTSSAVAKVIADETGAQAVEITTHVMPADGSYFTFMRKVTDVITNALKRMR